MAARRFAISYSDVLRPMFTVLGMGPGVSGVALEDGALTVHLGWGFRARVPVSAIGSAEPDDGAVTGWGAHGWRGRWLVNGSSRGLVRLTIDPPARGLVMGFPVRLRVLRLSLEEPAAFIEAIRRR